MAHEQPVPDAIGFEATVHAESGRLFAVAYAILRDVQEAEDAVQETMELALGVVGIPARSVEAGRLAAPDLRPPRHSLAPPPAPPTLARGNPKCPREPS